MKTMYIGVGQGFNQKTGLLRVDGITAMEVKVVDEYLDKIYWRSIDDPRDEVGDFRGVHTSKKDVIFDTKEKAISHELAKNTKYNDFVTNRRETAMIECYECGRKETLVVAKRERWENTGIMGHWHCGC